MEIHMKFAKILAPLLFMTMVFSVSAQTVDNAVSAEEREAILIERLAGGQVGAGDLTAEEVELLHKFAEYALGLKACDDCSDEETRARKGKVRDFFKKIGKWIKDNVEPVDLPPF